jgi:hypothetical protein
MKPSTPLIYSLPYRKSSGETDAAGLCTIGLIQWMQDASNEQLGRFGQLTGAVNAPAVPAPPICWLTDARTIRRRLLWYNRQALLVPLIRACSLQPTLGDSRVLGYELAQIEADVARAVFGGKTPIMVQVLNIALIWQIQLLGLSRLVSWRNSAVR